MATLVKGFTFADGHQITSARLNALVDSATISGIAQADFTSGYSVVTIGDNSPSSPFEGMLWFDTSPGAEEGILRNYTGSHWVPVGRGLLGYNTSGSTIAAGALVKDASSSGGTGNQRHEIADSTKHAVVLGMALTQITNGSLGVVITEGRVLNLLKETGTAVTAGDRVVPSATAGQATTSANANYGHFYGSGVIGVWTKDQTSGALSGEATLIRPAFATGLSFRTPVKLLDNVTPETNATWSGSFAAPQYLTWSATPPGVVARIIQWSLRETTATASDVDCGLAFRQRGSSLAITTGTPHVKGLFTSDNGSEVGEFGLAGQLIIPTDPAGDGTDRAEYFVDTDQTATNLRLTVYEVGVLCGGRVVN